MSFVGALFKKPKAPANELSLSFDTNAPRKLLLGKTALAGTFAFHGLTNDSRDMTRVIVLSGHRVNRLTRIWADGTLAVSNGLTHGVRTRISALDLIKDGGSRKPAVWMTFFDGRPNQTADSYLTSSNQQPVRWTSSEKLSGCAYIVVTMQHDERHLTSPVELIVEIEGARLYDRRLDATAGGAGSQRWNNPSTWTYTDNAAVATDHYQLGILGGQNSDKILFGMGLQTWQVPYDEFAANADTCDETVLGVSRYAVNGILSAADDHKDNVVKLAEAMAAVPYDTGGRVIIRPQQARPTRLTLLDSDLVDQTPYELSESPGGDDLVNTIKGEYREPFARHNDQEYPSVKDDALISKDGREFEVTLDLPLETNSGRAQRLASIELEVQKRRDIITETFMPIANVLEVGDWFERSSNLRGPITKTYEVTDKARLSNFTVRISARETDPSITSFGADQVRPVDVPESLEPYTTDRPVTAPATAEAIEITGGGTTQPSAVITIQIADIEDADRFDYFEVEFGLAITVDGESSIALASRQTRTFANVGQTQIELTGLLPATVYAWRLRFLSGTTATEWSAYDTFTSTERSTSTDALALGGIPAIDFASMLAENTDVTDLISRSREIRDAALAEARLSGQLQEATAGVDNANANYELGLTGYYSFTGAIPAELPNYCIVGRLIEETDISAQADYERNQAQEVIQGAVLLEQLTEELPDGE